MLCSVGHGLQIADKFTMIHYGFDADICKFMEAQSFVEKAIWIKPESRFEYDRLVSLSGRASNAISGWLPQMLRGSGVRAADVVPVHIHDIEEDGVQDRWYGAVLPEEPKTWAEAFLKSVGLERFYLLNPISLQSTQQDDHWPYWKQSIDWLLSCTDETYVLVGQKQTFESIEHPRLINISGYTESMLEVLALADRAAGLITTCNGLSYWSIINGIPAVVTSHRHHKSNRYFWNWLAYTPNRMVEYEQGVDVFSTLVVSMQATRI